MLPISSTSGATSRTRKLSDADPLSSMIRCEPSIMPMPSCWAAAARLRLMVPDSSAPPVIGPISSGARNREPRKSDGQVDAAEVGLGERVVRQPVALQPCGHRLVLDGLGQAHVDVPPFAGFHAAGVPRHRLSPLTQ